MLCLIVVIVALGLVDLARSGPERATVERHDSGSVDEEPPDELPGGHPLPPVPRAVAQAADGPVVVAATLEALPEGVDCLDEDAPWTAGPEATPILLTPDGLQMQFVGEGHPNHPGFAEGPSGEMKATGEADDPMALTMTCYAGWQRGSWGDAQSSLAAHRRGEKAPRVHSSEAGCCGHDGLGAAHAQVPVDDDVAWLLQDRGGYWLAHPTEGLSAVRVNWHFRESQLGGPGFDEPGFDGGTVVRLLDADGEVLDQHSVG